MAARVKRRRARTRGQNEKLIYLEYRNVVGTPSISIKVLPKSSVDITRLESKTSPASKEVVSELLMIVEFNGLEYEIRFKCDEASTNVHFDNKKGIAQVEQGWAEVNQRISVHGKIDKFSAFTFGISLHNLMDFYSHSNYVEMYLKYLENDLGKSLADFTLNDIPHWDEAVSGGFGQSEWYKRVCTGEFKLGEMMKGANTHAEMNKDTPSTMQGAKKIGGCKYTLYEIAYTAAAKHTSKFLKND